MISRSINDKPVEQKNIPATAVNQARTTAAVNAIKQGGAGFGSRSTMHAPAATTRKAGSEPSTREVEIRAGRLPDIQKAATDFIEAQEVTRKARQSHNKAAITAAENNETFQKLQLTYAISKCISGDNGITPENLDVPFLEKVRTTLKGKVAENATFKSLKLVAVTQRAIDEFCLGIKERSKQK
jgi:hypothetical protein